MTGTDRTTRRTILLSAAASGLLPRGRTASRPHLRTLRLGVIGLGVRGKYLIGNLPDNIQVSALCDCDMNRIESALNPSQEFRQVLEAFLRRDASKCSTWQDYRRMLEQESLDAVVIAAPDHHHAQATLLALQAGLHVYVEKPLALTIHEGRVIADAARKAARVVQVGSQQRTMEINRFACEFIRDGGLGQVHRVEIPNYPGPMTFPAFEPQPVPEGLDWDLFLGPTAHVAHHRKLWVKDAFRVDDLLWRGWDLFRQFSGHLVTNWGAHSIDMVQYALGKDDTGPVSVRPGSVAASRLQQDWQRKWKDKTPRPESSFDQSLRMTPIHLEYDDGTVIEMSPGVDAAIFHGAKGRLKMSRNQFVVDPIDLVRNPPGASARKAWEGSGHVARPHIENWLDAIGGTAELNAPVEVGHRTATVCHLINIARDLNRELSWDPVSERFNTDSDADKLLSRPRNSGFEIPRF